MIEEEKNKKGIIFLLSIVLLVLIVLSVGVGRYSIEIRLPQSHWL